MNIRKKTNKPCTTPLRDTEESSNGKFPSRQIIHKLNSKYYSSKIIGNEKVFEKVFMKVCFECNLIENEFLKLDNGNTAA